MSAEPIPSNESNSHRADLFLAKWRDQYMAEADKAVLSSLTTRTQGWQANYAAQRAEHRKVMNTACNSIAGHLEKVKSFDADDDTIKLIKEQVKNLVEERDAHASWEMRAVYVYKASADVCDQIRDTALRAARDHEASAPLVEHGLVDAVIPVLKSWPCPVWDDDKGVMTVE